MIHRIRIITIRLGIFIYIIQFGFGAFANWSSIVYCDQGTMDSVHSLYP